MADLKENELAQKKDFNYVRALDASGNSILINKADFAKVVEELLPLPVHIEQVIGEDCRIGWIKIMTIKNVTEFNRSITTIQVSGNHYNATGRFVFLIGIGSGTVHRPFFIIRAGSHPLSNFKLAYFVNSGTTEIFLYNSIDYTVYSTQIIQKSHDITVTDMRVVFVENLPQGAVEVKDNDALA